MRALLLGLIGGLGVWFALTAWILDFPATDARLIATALGLAVTAVAMVVIHWSGTLGCRLVGLLGCAIVVVGIVGVLGGPSARLNEIVIGLLVALVGFIAGEIAKPAPVSAVDKDGHTLAEIKTITRKGDVVAMKAQLLGAMPATIYVSPEELWKIVGLLGADTAFALPRLLTLGWLRVRRQPRAEPSRPREA
jgi:multisubunit Na+/H+ antiporter MnhF subunit